MNRTERRAIRTEFHRLLEFAAQETIRIVRRNAPHLGEADVTDAAVDQIRKAKIDGTDVLDKLEDLIRKYSDRNCENGVQQNPS